VVADDAGDASNEDRILVFGRSDVVAVVLVENGWSRENALSPCINRANIDI
jgi:hypothetical protein